MTPSIARNGRTNVFGRPQVRAHEEIGHETGLGGVVRQIEEIGEELFLLAAQAGYAATGSFPELLSIYHLLGEPAMQLR